MIYDLLIKDIGYSLLITSCEALSPSAAYSTDKCLNPFLSVFHVSFDPVAQDDTGVASLLITL